MAEARPLRVLQVLPALNEGGVEQGTLEIAQALVEHGHTAFVASSGGRLVSRLEQLGATHIELPLHSKNPFTIWRNARMLTQLIRKQQIDIVHARSRAPAWSAYLACQRTDTPFVTTFHGAYGHQIRGHQSWLKRRYNSVMCRGTPIIAVSQFIAAHIQQVYGIAAQRITVIPRGVDTSKFVPENIAPTRIDALRQQWRLAPQRDNIVLMLPGRLTRIKGHQLLLDALVLVPELPLHCLIVGSDHDSPYTQALKAKVAALNLSDRVQFTGHCADMPAAYQLADVIISATTKPESFGRTLVEAQAAGRIVIAPNHGASPEVVADREFLFEPGNVTALTQTLRQVCALDAETRRTRTEAARDFVQTQFALHQMCDKTLAVYKRQTAQHPHRHTHG